MRIPGGLKELKRSTEQLSENDLTKDLMKYNNNDTTVKVSNRNIVDKKKGLYLVPRSSIANAFPSTI